MTEAQGTELIGLLTEQNSMLQAVGTLLARCEYWLHICALLLIACLFFAAWGRRNS